MKKLIILFLIGMKGLASFAQGDPETVMPAAIPDPTLWFRR